MSIECIQYDGQLKGLPYKTAKLYGMPHIGCRYYRDDVNAVKWTGDFRTCAACGKSGGQHSKHHEPPKSKGCPFLLECRKSDTSPGGRFALKPALIDLCGSGTTGCHGNRHNGMLRVSWEWDSDEYERMWWDGTFLSHGKDPHGTWLYLYGCYVFEADDGTGTWSACWTYREEQ